MSKTMPVFVYGTLLEGFMNHALYAKPYDCEVQPAKIKGEVYHLPQGYPGLLAGNEDVIGEILLFSPEVFEGTKRSGRAGNLLWPRGFAK
jgi:gamma-glutamylcyclotransferase (GGCT)/AIG2-like uncharacterized protein YtfP